MAANRTETEEDKKITSNKTATIKVHLQIKMYEAFDRFVNSMNSLSSSTTYEEMFIRLIQQSSNTTKYSFLQVGGKLSGLPNQRRDTVAREMIRIMKWQSTIKWRSNIIMSPCHLSPSSSSSSFHPLPLMEHPIIIPPISYLCRSPSYLSCIISEMQTILVLRGVSVASGVFVR